MEIINDKFIISNQHISECMLLTHSINLNDIILLYTNNGNVLLFNYEKRSKSYSTDVYYKNEYYKIILKKQKTALTYMCCIYFDNNVPLNTRKKISKHLCKIINVSYLRGYENGPDFNKILSALMDNYYECFGADLNEMLDANKSKYNYIKTKLNYKCDLSNGNINCDVQNMLLLDNGINVYEYVDDDLPECNTHFDISEHKIIPGYCFKYIPLLKQYIINDDEDTIIIEFNEERYDIYNGDDLEYYFTNKSVLFKFDEHYVLGYKLTN